MNSHVFRQSGDGSLAFVGDFDALYKADEDTWEQSGGEGVKAWYYRESRRNLLTALKRHIHRGSCLEIGSGHGHVTAMLGSAFGQCVGIEISKEAVKQALALHSYLSFIVADITAQNFIPPNRFDVVVLGQCWWYVLHAIGTALQNCLRCLKPGGLFVITQAFVRDQRYGRDIADGFDGAARLVMATAPRLKLVEAWCHCDEPFDDGLLIFRNAG